MEEFSISQTTIRVNPISIAGTENIRSVNILQAVPFPSLRYLEKETDGLNPLIFSSFIIKFSHSLLEVLTEVNYFWLDYESITTLVISVIFSDS